MVAVYMLGKALIDLGTTRITPQSVRKFALLLRLCAEPGRRIPRTILHELIFADQTDTNARHSLRELVYQFRQMGLAITADRSFVELDPATVRLDSTLLISATLPDPEQLKAAEAGLLPGYEPTLSEGFTEWLESYRARITFELTRSLVGEVTRARGVGDWRAMERAARACLGLDPLNEEGTLALAEILAVGGGKIQALRLLDSYLAEVGESSRDLRIPAAILRRRISEQDSTKYRSPSTSPFVGRERQMAALRQHLSLAKHDETQCVVITGEPGIGKSRLVAEFCTIAALEATAVVVASTQPNDLYRPFGAFADLLPSLLSMRGALGCAPETLRLLDRLQKSPTHEAGSYSEAVPDSESLCHSITNAIIDLIDAVASEQALMLAMEDAHWLDQMSIRVLGCLVSKQRRRRILALLTTRQLDSIEPLTRNAETADVIELGQLDNLAMRRITTGLGDAGEVLVDPDMQDWLSDTASGNPLFLETLFAHFASTGQRFTISPTLSNLVARRLDSLSPEAATTLRVCALLGKHSTLDTIVNAVQLPPFALLRAVAELESARLIRTDGQSIQPAHRLIADTAQQNLPPIARRLAHQCVASALESILTAEQSTALLWDCAEHWIAAQNSAKALNAIRRCATRAVEIGRPTEAAEVLSWAIGLDLERRDQIAVCRGLVLAADAASEHALVFRGLEILRKHQLPPDHDDLEFVEFRACARAWYDAPAQEAKLLRCIRAQDASANHRVMAATWLLKHADVQHNSSLAAEAVSALDHSVIETADEAVRLEFMLIRDCGLAEWDRAATTARRLLKAAHTTSPQISLSLQLNASVAFERCGLVSEAIQTATSLFFEAESRGMHRIRVRAAAFIAEQFFDDGDDVAAAEWFGRIVNASDHASDLSGDFAPTVALLSYLLTIEDAERAKRLFDRVERAGMFAGGNVRARWRRVLAERLRHFGMNDEPAQEFRPEFTDADRTAWMMGIADFEVATGCHALLRSNCPDAAGLLFSQYMAARLRSRTRISRSLREVGKQLMCDLPAKAGP